LAGSLAVLGGLGQPDKHTVFELFDERVGDGGVTGVDGGVAGVTGKVGLVDQPAQRPGDLGRPLGVGVDLGN
jgi:hypothetical protein